MCVRIRLRCSRGYIRLGRKCVRRRKPIRRSTRSRIILFSRKYFRGRRLYIYGNVPDLSNRRYRFNDKTSSIIVQGKYNWQVFRHVDYVRRLRVLRPGRYPNARRIGGNNVISSVRRQGRPQLRKFSYVILYSKPNFKGRRILVLGNVKDLRKRRFNDKTNSIKIRGNRPYVVYQHINYVKALRILRPGSYPTPRSIGGGDKISSLKTLPIRRRPRYRPRRRRDYVILFSRRHFRGRRVVVYGSIPDLRRRPYNFNDKAQSVIIRGRRTWRLYKHIGYRRLVKVLRPGRYATPRRIGGYKLLSSIRRSYIPRRRSYAILFSRPRFRGRRVVIRGNVRDLRSRRYRFNDKTNSIIVRGRRPRGYVMLFSKPNFRGRRLVVLGNVRDLTTRRYNFNDKTNSIIVRGRLPFAVYKHVNYVRRVRVLRPGKYPTPRSIGGGNQISSLRRLRRKRYIRRSYAILFSRPNFRGRRIVVRGNVRDLRSRRYRFNDKTNSIIVRGRRPFAVYKHIHYVRRVRILRPGRYPTPRSIGGGNQISSLRVTRHRRHIRRRVLKPRRYPKRKAIVISTIRTHVRKTTTTDEKYFQPPPMPKPRPRPLGMETGIIVDRAITSSSSTKVDVAENARPAVRYGWRPAKTDRKPWIQVDLTRSMEVHGMGILGHQTKKCWTTKYMVKVSLDGVTYRPLLQKNSRTSKIFVGNQDQNTWKHFCLHRYYGHTIKARYVRFYPLESNGCIGMRFELFGFRDGNDPLLLRVLRSPDAWTKTITGCQCYFDKSRFDCPCCQPGGCQCARSNPHQCVQCGFGSNCGIPRIINKATEVDPWTKSTTGCTCHWDKSRKDCACCQNYGCQCGRFNKNQCVQCGRPSQCGQKESIFGPNKHCIPKTCPKA